MRWYAALERILASLILLVGKLYDLSCDGLEEAGWGRTLI